MNRKANWAFFGLAFGVFVASGIILFNMAQSDPNVEYIGQTANIILDNTEKQQNSFLRLDHNVDIIAENAVKQTARKNGINGTEKCKELGYKVLDNGCEQDITQVFNDNVESGLDAISSNLPHIQNVEISHQLNQDGTISYKSQSALTFTVERESTIPTPTEKQGTTPFGEPLVSLTDLPRIECEKSSCTGYEKQCAVKPNVYNQLEQLSNYLEKHGYRAEITSSTRTVEMQKFFFDMNQYCNQVKENRCSGDKDKRACRTKYRQVLRDTGQNNRLACRPGGSCEPACDPLVEINGEEKPNDQCRHMRGDAVDIRIYAKGKRLSKMEDMLDVKRRTMCEFGFVNFYEEHWHYEYESAKWKTLRSTSDDTLECADGQGKDIKWEEVPMLHEALSQ